MKWTNKQNLPQPYFLAVSRSERPHKANTISVTEMLKPPQMRCLGIRHDEEIEVDVGSWGAVAAFMGTAMHAALCHSENPEDWVEKRLETEIEGWTLTGQLDLLEEDGTLTDYKSSSVWSVILGDKDEWQRQLEAYAFLAAKHGKIVKRAQITIKHRDWSGTQAKRNPDYPQTPAYNIDIKLRPMDVVEKWIVECVQRHKVAETAVDANLPECDPVERWLRGQKWAVMKKGRKSAVSLCDEPREAAHKAAALGSNHYVDHRVGKSVRCLEWCLSAPFCHQMAEINRAEGAGSGAAIGAQP